MQKVSIIIPAYNEKGFIRECLQRLDELAFEGLEKEIIIVDDASDDGTGDILRSLAGKYRVFFHQENRGKGAALKTGFKQSAGDIIAIQDADLEYDPRDLKRLVEPIVQGRSDIVYGSRMAGNNPVGHRCYYLGNLLIAKLASLLYGGRLTDVETCYKVFRREVLEGLDIESDDFAFEVEFTAKVLKRGRRILEIPISYRPRRFDQGKKISWRDGMQAIFRLIKYRF